MTAAEKHAQNRTAWNQTASWYAEQARAATGLLRGGGVTLQPVERELLAAIGPLSQWCDRAVHLQCAGGMDTISLTNLGAREAIGVDIAEDLVEQARTLATTLGRPVSFRTSDVLDLPRDLDATASLVYTGKGAIHWIHDLRTWGRSVARLLRPGGWFLLYDFHPMMWLFDSRSDTLRSTGISYFAPQISYRGWADGHIGELNVPDDGLEAKHLRPWPPSAVVQSLLDARLELAAFAEYPDTVPAGRCAFPQMAERDRRKVATTYAVLARKADR
ncbi:class I SAM-dependent methyltransferase [Lentzea sp. NBC_00516]|uniref:class I SAM-dependent methyltransferase n=1 Tax=Lentzea sp. NBC_00516 TaxID=2903582 RepID=UPI002E816534|nr:class I SAM-dependent methyltransferase [Lentzea sp. NBC_00516]WUD26864.1 class I SAM-dependent methyltransferase [Lentzea sp. NBC_00516]